MWQMCLLIRFYCLTSVISRDKIIFIVKIMQPLSFSGTTCGTVYMYMCVFSLYGHPINYKYYYMCDLGFILMASLQPYLLSYYLDKLTLFGKI